MVANWMAPVLFGVSTLCLGRAFYVIYARKRGTTASRVMTWLATAIVIGFWIWRLTWQDEPPAWTSR